MPAGSEPAAPEKAAPQFVADFVTEFVARADKEYALLEEHSDGPPTTSLFNFQIEELIYGLHCLDRAVLAYWGAEYRAAFMNCAFGFACEMFSDVLPDSDRERFLDEFKKLCDIRQTEYGAMKPLPGKDGAMKNVLAYEYTKRICIDAGVYNPPVQFILMECANGILTMMLKIAEEL
jgi:hypothetical protein